MGVVVLVGRVGGGVGGGDCFHGGCDGWEGRVVAMVVVVVLMVGGGCGVSEVGGGGGDYMVVGKAGDGGGDGIGSIISYGGG